MREIPILFNAEMVRAILGGIKTQTRRPDKGRNPFGEPGDTLWVRETIIRKYIEETVWTIPGGEPDEGHRWVPWTREYIDEQLSPNDDHHAQSTHHYCADGEPPDIDDHDFCWGRYKTPSIHTRRNESRINLRVKRVWQEKLKAISGDDCKAEVGIMFSESGLLAAFRKLWNSIYASDGLGWDANPMLWCCEFEVMT